MLVLVPLGFCVEKRSDVSATILFCHCDAETPTYKDDDEDENEDEFSASVFSQAEISLANRDGSLTNDSHRHSGVVEAFE